MHRPTLLLTALFALACGSGEETSPPAFTGLTEAELEEIDRLEAEAARWEVRGMSATHQLIEALHRQVPEDAANSYHVITGSYEDVWAASDAGDHDGDQKLILDAASFEGLTEGYWVVSVAHGELAAMNAVCAELKPETDCYVKEIGAAR